MTRGSPVAEAGHTGAVLVAGCATLLLIPLLVVAVVTLVATQLLNAATWKDAFAAVNVYGRASEAIASQLAYQRASSGAPPLRAGPATVLSSAQIETLFRVIPSAWLRRETERLLDQVFLDDPGDVRFVVNMADLKRYVASDAAVTQYLVVTRTLPACTESEIAAWLRAAQPSCRPPDDVLTAATPALRVALAAFARALPDEIDLSAVTAANAAAAGRSVGPGPGSTTLGEIRRTMWLVVLSPLVLSGLVALLVVRTRRALMLWVGVPLAMAGGLTFSLVLGATRGIDEAAITTEASPWSPAFAHLILDVGRYIADKVVWWARGLSALMALGGILLIVTSRRPAEPTPGDAAPAPFYT